MSPKPSQAPSLPRVHRLLGNPTDLQGHLDVHGPLNVARGRSGSWQHELVASLEESGLTGRGGGAFPTAVKLTVAQTAGRGGIVLVNAMEGEPASSKDQLLLTRAPHLVLDGAQYVATLCGSDRVVVCVPNGRVGVAAAVRHAIQERRAQRYVRVCEEIAHPPDRFTAGEESALANWIESERSAPVFRPDKGIALRIKKRPALVQNAETLAHIALVARYGAGPFRDRGIAEEPGTCLVTLSGAVAHSGVVEVDKGTPLWDIALRGEPVEPIQALLVGGYGGAWLGPDHFRTPYASIPLRTVGATAGVGVIVALGETSCGLAESARIARYLAEESSGQCGPCTFGLPAIADDLARLAAGQADEGLLPRLERRLRHVNGRGACRHPDGAVALVQSALSVFGADVALHSRGATCSSWRKPTILRFPRPIGMAR
jgi:NADH:ubiquinone oxidoreductase subunit F (NADH-binding)